MAAGQAAQGAPAPAPVVPDPDTLPPGQRARRERIVQAALDLLSAGEYERVQMRDVAERAGVALATVYRYFTSKEHLYAAVLLQWSADYRPRSRAGEPGQTAEERLRALLRRAVRAFERWPQLMRVLIVLESSTDPNARALYDRYAAQNSAALSAALQNLPPEAAAAVVETMQSVLGGRLRTWALGRCTIDDVHRSVQQAVTLIFSPPPPDTSTG